MLRHYFDGLQSINAYAIVSLLTFFLFFAGMVTWLLRVDKKYLESMGNKPLDEKDPSC